MQSEKVSVQSVELEGLSDQIEAWRRARPRTRAMPELRVFPARVCEFPRCLRLACLPLARGEWEGIHASRKDVDGVHRA